MNVNKINNVSFEKRHAENAKAKLEKDNAEYQQINIVASKDAAKALRNIAMGLMVLGATVGASSCLTDCTDKYGLEKDAELPENWVITNQGDTVVINSAEAYDNFLNPKFH